MRITTKLILDIETGAVLEHQHYDYFGPVCMAKASDAEKALSAEQSSFFKELSADYATQFAGQQAILNSLTKSITPILNAGPNQEGFSTAEKAAYNSQIMNGTATNYKNAQTAVSEAMAAKGGGNTFMPKGADAEVAAGIAEQAAGQESQQQLALTQADYATGRAQYDKAVGALEGTAGIFNPAGFAGQATSAGSQAFGSAEKINQENNAWKGQLGGILGGVAGSILGGPIGGSIAGKIFGGGGSGGANDQNESNGTTN